MTLSVLNKVHTTFEEGHLSKITRRTNKLRTVAIREVAKEEGVTSKTVFAHCIKKDSRYLITAKELDQLISQWLIQGQSLPLITFLSKGTRKYDQKQIADFFDIKFEFVEELLKGNVVELLNTPKAKDIEEPEVPNRVNQEIYRILRDTAIARQLKKKHQYECQICGDSLQINEHQKYIEVHHIKPLGKPHNGPDVSENIICVCPNHHVLLDYGAINLNVSELNQSNLHHIDEKYVNYHNTRIFNS